MDLGNLKQNDEKKENLLGFIYVTKYFFVYDYKLYKKYFHI